MSALHGLKGSLLDGIWIDAPGHTVTLSLRSTNLTPPVGYTLVLEGVTDFHFFDDSAEPWSGAELTDIRSDHDPGSLRLDFSFGSESSGLALTCAKVVLHRTRSAE
ncbi:hypothetical protein HNR23_003411 [Nocardiopsis mwathae]|uniref:Uncharacterized protein n=1 Tax=Nocardiopsis mwathae TaxID=1472723 RepID=A0A7W9YLH9_9ACTN|nr:hypothetical protein [Nocardiopsis mwathae]MBB6173351.1 hypothetical protein [Nocardiopsis mwathae]